jgi:hypothetical protein
MLLYSFILHLHFYCSSKSETSHPDLVFDFPNTQLQQIDGLVDVSSEWVCALCCLS